MNKIQIISIFLSVPTILIGLLIIMGVIEFISFNNSCHPCECNGDPDCGANGHACHMQFVTCDGGILDWFWNPILEKYFSIQSIIYDRFLELKYPEPLQRCCYLCKKDVGLECKENIHHKDIDTPCFCWNKDFDKLVGANEEDY